MTTFLMQFLSFVKDKGLRIKDNPRSARGFTVLFAVLIGSLLFSLGIAISQLSIKEIVLSSTGKQSETAFFAADTGIECALYWDFRIGREEEDEFVFPSYNDEVGDGYESIECNGDSEVEIFPVIADSTSATSTFTLTFVPSGCAEVIVGKTSAGSTVIESRGRNECGLGANPGRVERALRVRY
ncbi:MAG: hypothetical protein UY50_C0026G0013 [Parcubacteria group bacterium GW2011_GWA2_49_9]|nr:MAG: hypothetical protein UY50_C0026G0013 [Parcubacteria group bacterium GW2011_GWA2_49_9]